MHRIVLWLTLLAGSLAQQDLDSKVFLFPKASATAHVILKPTLTKSLDKLTVCLRSYSGFGRSHPLFSLAMQGQGKDNTFLIVTNPPNLYVYVNQEGNQFKTSPETIDWKHICVTWDSDTGVIQLWVNGKLYPRLVSKKGFSINTPTSIILGQEQDSFGGGFDINESFVGEITDVHMWDYVLPPNDIHNALFNNKNTNGNVISWRSLQYELKESVLVQPKLQCKSQEYIYSYYSQCYEK
ncbi:C-reactive protein-like [Discoglossus pictus]